jgi:uracil-DNA glycosylase family 4
MSFIPSPKARLVPGLGKGTEKIVIVGDFTSAFDDRLLKPFSGPAGTVLESCLHAAGLIRSDVYLTNVIKTKSNRAGIYANTEYFIDKGQKKHFTELGLEHVALLQEELSFLKANVIVAAGNAAIQAVSSLTSAAKYRGYVCEANKIGNRKMIPTHSPANTMRGSYTNRHMIIADLRKAKMESDFPEIVRPDRRLIYGFQTVEEVLEWLDYYAQVDLLCFDIEVINYEVSCISFAASPDIGVVVPIGDSTMHPGWTEQEEYMIWRGIQRVLGNPKSEKIIQNSIFDTHFLLTKNGVVVRGKVRDTMIAHSVMFPELPKGLDFLGSIYCGSQEYWKDSVKFNNIKGDS